MEWEKGSTVQYIVVRVCSSLWTDVFCVFDLV
jgi:hypothetical protein